ncbi:MAG: hypothetical protein ACHQ4H_02040 [Ktedonobacterales bacterium]
MFNRKADPKAVARKMAALSIAWAVVAGIAYLGLIQRAIKFVTDRTPWPGVTVDPGITKLASAALGTHATTISNIIVAALPVAIVAVAALGIIARVRPSLPAVSPLLILAALLGLAGSVLLFVALVANVKNGTELVVALATIVLVSILLRLSRFIRRFYNRTPAVASVFFAALTLAYLLLSNGANISSIVLAQLDLWLSLLAFAITIYAGIALARAHRAMRKR